MIKKQYSIIINYLFLIMPIIIPLYASKYVQTFDMPWGPLVPISKNSNVCLLTLIMHTAAIIVSSALIQKILLLVVFVMPLLGIHHLMLTISIKKRQPILFYVAGVLYLFNPFFYTRLLAGQWLVLLGYALLPWALGRLWQFMQKPSWSSTWRAAAWTALIGLTSIHVVGFVALAAVIFFVAQGRSNLKLRIYWSAAVAGLWLLANALWVVPLAFGKSHISGQIGGFGASQLHAFATSAPVAHSVPLSTLVLEGFWADPQGRYVLPSHLGAWWWIVVALLGGLIITGIVSVVRKKDRLGISLLILAAIAWWLGMGVGWHYSAGTSIWLVNHLPFYRGYREPQKWLMLLALGYAYFAAAGTGQIYQLLKKHEKLMKISLTNVVAVVCILPILYTPVLLWGAAGQLHSRPYPKDYAAAQNQLQNCKNQCQVVVFPWHMYLPISYAGRVVANPAPYYFNEKLITSDNPELQGVPPSQSTPLLKLIDNQLLPQRYYRSDAAAQLAPYHVRYILLLKEADWRRYDWLNKQKDIRVVQDSPHIRVYAVKPEGQKY